jgi:CheY-like chemotaxis protein
LFYHLLIHTFTKPKNVLTTIRFSTSTEAANSEEVSMMTKSGRNDDIEASSPPNTSIEQIRVVIADDHPVARQGLSAILGSLDDVKVVAEAADGEEACKLYHQHFPDVLIVDLRMPKKDGLRVVEELMSGGPPKPRIIVITTYEDEEDIRRALTAGAKALCWASRSANSMADHTFQLEGNSVGDGLRAKQNIPESCKNVHSARNPKGSRSSRFFCWPALQSPNLRIGGRRGSN